jgi:hypothetical protein
MFYNILQDRFNYTIYKFAVINFAVSAFLNKKPMCYYAKVLPPCQFMVNINLRTSQPRRACKHVAFVISYQTSNLTCFVITWFHLWLNGLFRCFLKTYQQLQSIVNSCGTLLSWWLLLSQQFGFIFFNFQSTL